MKRSDKWIELIKLRALLSSSLRLHGFLQSAAIPSVPTLPNPIPGSSYAPPPSSSSTPISQSGGQVTLGLPGAGTGINRLGSTVITRSNNFSTGNTNTVKILTSASTAGSTTAILLIPVSVYVSSYTIGAINVQVTGTFNSKNVFGTVVFDNGDANAGTSAFSNGGAIIQTIAIPFINASLSTFNNATAGAPVFNGVLVLLVDPGTTVTVSVLEQGPSPAVGGFTFNMSYTVGVSVLQVN